MRPALDIEPPPETSLSTAGTEPPQGFPRADRFAKDQALRTLIDDLLEEQRTLTAVESFSRWHDRTHKDAARTEPPSVANRYAQLLPASPPGPGEQYAFEVNLDACSGCKACVTACHTLNGLDDEEAWREVGTLVGATSQSPWQQTVTTACHHCVDPGCLNGCPVLAYEKDPVTGIVRHLDDQCIGCQYCVLKCPYEVPKYSAKRGIVRKCDLCSQRLAVDEAPACAQACPNQAIRVTVVRQQAFREQARTAAAGGQRTRNPFLPGSPNPRWTVPTTHFKTSRSEMVEAVPADLGTPRPQPLHAPLVAMLTLTQMGVGIQAAAWLAPELPTSTQRFLQLVATVAILAGLAASTMHLGRPLKAWRAFLGLRRSWLSREIVVFGLLPPLLLVPLIAPLFPNLPSFVKMTDRWTAWGVVVGFIGIVCSAMIYHDTGRHSWRGWRTFSRFLGTLLVSGLATGWSLSTPGSGAQAMTVGALVIVVALKLVLESLSWRPAPEDAIDPWQTERSRRVLRGPLAKWNLWRTGAAVVGLVGMIAGTLAQGGAGWLLGSCACACLAAGEFCERALFFRAVSVPRMPGLNGQGPTSAESR